jgi:hypothetical protein
MAEAEVLAPGDSVAIQGQLLFLHKENRIVGLYIIAGQIMALRKRSVNRLPTGCAAAAL